MNVNQITKSFRYTFRTMLHAKLRNFIKRSIWKYFFASFLLAYALKDYVIDTDISLVNATFVIFICVILFGFFLIIISSYVLYRRKRKDNMDITFSENQIEIYWMVKDKKEIKAWNWIKSSEVSNNIYYLNLGGWPKNILMIIYPSPRHIPLPSASR
ncbi:MAG: hypothetical protein H7Y18_05435 [Clostridiaceae bacterium]|nr:hypothetical protein [Clostridiaceae bacterium]